MNRMKRLIVCAVSLILLIPSIALLSPREAYALPSIQRLSGKDRYKTAMEILKPGWDKSQNVVLATGESFPDALCAAPLAKQLNAPILLTRKLELDPDLALKLKSLGTQNVYIIGGESVISKNVENSLVQKGFKVVRIWGNDRYETSISVAEYIHKNFKTGSEIVVATGADFPDALSAAPIAAKRGMPIILSPGGKFLDSIKEYLSNSKVTKSYIIGGTGVISSTVADKFPGAERIWGDNRYETNIKTINYFRSDFDYIEIFVATGEDFPDALSGSALAARHSSPVVLTSKTPKDITRGFVYNYCQPNSITSTLYILGGTTVIPDSTIQKLSTRDKITGRTVTLGTSLNDTLGILGDPQSKYDGAFLELCYSDASVYLTYKTSPWQVVGWYNKGNTKISMGTKYPGAYPFTLGSSKEAVIDAMGTPYYILPVDPGSRSNWVYWLYQGDSRVDFNYDYKVCSWTNKGNLSVSMGLKSDNAVPFTLGSSYEDVVRAMGTPDELSANVVDISFNNIRWTYKTSSVFFTVDKKVKGFNNKGDLKVDMGKLDPSAPGIFEGMDMAGIIKAMGTPDEIGGGTYFERAWRYGTSYIGVDSQNKVIGWVNNGNLKVASGGADGSAPPISVGSTREDVIKAMGYPDENMYGTWHYGESSVTFNAQGLVKDITNSGHNIKVAYSTKDPSVPSFTLGSLKEDVVKAMGTPDIIRNTGTSYGKEELTWVYGLSSIYFDDNGRVLRWDNTGNLKVSIGTMDPSAPPVTLGSFKGDVIKAMGTPDAIYYEQLTTDVSWIYKNSNIIFNSSSQVVGWTNNGNLKVSIGVADPSARPFTLSSSLDDVAKAMGTPVKIDPNTWGGMTLEYGSSTVDVDAQGKVTGWYNSGNLKILTVQANPSALPFALNSPWGDVINTMGTPNYISRYSSSYTRWIYGDSTVNFNNDGTVAFWDNRGNLNVSLGRPDPSASPIDIGSSLQSVIKAMGTPSSMAPVDYGFEWHYGTSVIGIDSQNIVIMWLDYGNLKVKQVAPDPASTPFTLGSSKDDVIKAMGTPDEACNIGGRNIYLRYGSSYVYFDSGWKVISFNNAGNLKVR